MQCLLKYLLVYFILNFIFIAVSAKIRITKSKSLTNLQDDKRISIEASNIDFYEKSLNLLTSGIEITLDNPVEKEIKAPFNKSKTNEKSIFLYYKDINCKSAEIIKLENKESMKLKTVDSQKSLEIAYKSSGINLEDFIKVCNNINKQLLESYRIHKEKLNENIGVVNKMLKNWEKSELKIEADRKSIDEFSKKIEANHALMKEKAQKVYLFHSNSLTLSKLVNECQKLERTDICSKIYDYFKLGDEKELLNESSNDNTKLSSKMKTYKDSSHKFLKDMERLTNSTISLEDSIVEMRMDVDKKREDMIRNLFSLSSIDADDLKGSFSQEVDEIQGKITELDSTIEKIERSFK